MPRLLLTATAQAGPYPPFKAGVQDLALEGSPPLCDADELKARFRSKEDAGAYDVSKERFRVVVPKAYTHAAAWGRLVQVNADDGASLPSGYEAVLAKRKLLAVSAYRSDNPRNIFGRFRLAIDAAYPLGRRFHLDPDRVYLSGFSGGGHVASMLAVAYADVFGYAVPLCGVNFYTDIPSGHGRSWPRGYVPVDEALEIAKARGRYVLVTGEKDMNLANTRAVFEHGFKAEGFKHARLLEVTPLSPSDLRAIDPLPRNPSARGLRAAGPLLPTQGGFVRAHLPLSYPAALLPAPNLNRFIRLMRPRENRLRPDELPRSCLNLLLAA